MKLTERELVVLKALAAACQKLVDEAEQPRRAMGGPSHGDGAAAARPRIRRTGDELAEFRRLLIEERDRGVPAADIARKYGVSRSYIYNLKA
ncbi:MAG TPA: hypothetical protein VIL72_12430 [Beijerinckiaceae bacterium]